MSNERWPLHKEMCGRTTRTWNLKQDVIRKQTGCLQIVEHKSQPGRHFVPGDLEIGVALGPGLVRWRCRVVLVNANAGKKSRPVRGDLKKWCPADLWATSWGECHGEPHQAMKLPSAPAESPKGQTGGQPRPLGRVAYVRRKYVSRMLEPPFLFLSRVRARQFAACLEIRYAGPRKCESPGTEFQSQHVGTTLAQETLGQQGF
jgi:hypothetical protein